MVKVGGKYHEVPDDWGYELARHGYGTHYLVRGDADVSFNQYVYSLWFGIPVGDNPPDEWYSASCVGINFNNPVYTMGTCAPDVP